MKTLVVTGGSKGIGLATAELFAAQGYRVVNLSRSAIPLPDAIQLSVDMAEPGWTDRHSAALLAAVGDGGQLVLVHNAALLSKDRVEDLDATRLARVLQINVVAPQQLNRILLARMGSGSAIVYVGSTLAEKAVAGSCAYVVSKHALLGLMRATCQDLAGRGIHTACVCPGFTDTEMLRAHVGQNPAILGSLARGVTFGRLVEPVEVARTILFCAENPVINGAVIHANLGQVEH
ncbi:MAG: SDR family oxidoreductase [Pseudomonadales bacterium]|nr:SDR family oxidoreductase [Pseudomonadales bacterium]